MDSRNHKQMARQNYGRSLILFVFIVCMITSCNIIRPYKSPEISKRNLFRDKNPTDTTSIASLPYSEMFRDTILQGLIREGIEENLDLKVAYTRIRQSEAYFRQSTAALFPTLNGNVGLTESRLSEVQGFGIRTRLTQYQIGVSSSWEADVFGRLRSNRRAAFAALLQTEAGARAVQTTLVAEIAINYYLLLALDQQLDITNQTISNWDTTVTTMRALKEAAIVTEAAVVQSEAQRYSAEVTIPDIKQTIRETENTLSILLGRVPGAIERGILGEQETIPQLSTGVPAQLLANRPDVQQAEFAYRNSFEFTNAARAAFYPALTITGTAGFSSSTIETLINPVSLAASIGAGLAQPIFNRRLNRTNLVVAEAEQQANFLNFGNALLQAGREVSDALSLHSNALEKITVRSSQIDALQKSVSYTQELLRNGFANYNEVITARQSLLSAELGRANDDLQRLHAAVNLYRALGGGWK
jgi:multidrug efflux system outer membrane protein